MNELQDQQSSPIELCVQSIKGDIAELSHGLLTLKEKISPVCRDENPASQEENKTKGLEGTSPMERELNQIRMEMIDLIRLVKNTIERVHL